MRRLRLWIVFALVCLPLVIDARTGVVASPLPFDASSAPHELGGLVAVEDVPLEEDVVSMLEPDSYVMRRYAGREGPDTWLYLAAYSGFESTGAHDPAVCYPANGWDLSTLAAREIRLEDGASLLAHLLLARQAGREELVLYWFQPVDRWPRRAPVEQILRAVDSFRGRPQYVFVRLSTRLEGSVEDGERELVELARELAPWLRSSMSGSGPGIGASLR